VREIPKNPEEKEADSSKMLLRVMLQDGGDPIDITIESKHRQVLTEILQGNDIRS
jgi:hypothetical protein